MSRGLCCTCLHSPGTPSSSWGFCPLVSAFRAHPLCFGACAHLSWLPWSVFSFAGFVFTFVSSVCPPSMLRGLCVLVLSHQSAFFVAGFMCSSFGSPGLPSVPRGLCALPKFVCLSLSLCTPGCPLHCEGCLPFRDFYAMPHSSPSLCQKGCMCWRG